MKVIDQRENVIWIMGSLPLCEALVKRQCREIKVFDDRRESLFVGRRANRAWGGSVIVILALEDRFVLVQERLQFVTLPLG